MNSFGFNNTIFPHHPLKIYNKKLNWFNNDKLKRYNPIDNLYTIDDITYEFNSHGFRCDEFKFQSDFKIVFLGCSITEGIGLKQTDTWAYKLLEMIRKDTGLNIPFWNLALAGVGIDSITRAFYHYHNLLKPKIIFGYFPEYRRELYYLKDYNDLAAYTFQNKELLEQSVMIDERTILYETEKNFSFIDLMIKNIDSTMIWNTWSKNNIYPNLQIKHNFELGWDNKARDREHPGSNLHSLFADNIYSEYRKLILSKINE